VLVVVEQILLQEYPHLQVEFVELVVMVEPEQQHIFQDHLHLIQVVEELEVE
tara:strand:+ start:189 stop:344 length:156 start_codon:yes stop_codon:yes gene_type:complete